MAMECGSRQCLPFAFCHEATNTCRECSDICHQERHSSYEPSLCLEHCRDYMLEQLRSHASADDSARAARALGAAGLGLSLAALLGLLLLAGALLFLLYRRPATLLRCLQNRVKANSANHVKDKNSKCDIDRGMDGSVCTVSGSISEPELRLHQHHLHAAVPQQPCTSTPAPSPIPLGLGPPPLPPARHPSEDSTLDYAAYDNPALSPSSSPQPVSHSVPVPVPLLPGAVLANGSVPHPHATESSF